MRVATILLLTATLTPLFAPAAAQPPPAQPPPIRLGIDTFLAEPVPLKGQRVGLVTHQAGVTREGHPTAVALQRIPGITLAALFAPEHGMDGTYGAGQPVPTLPGRTPVYSLYGDTFRPTRAMLARVEVLVVDLQDVGVRPYTYASTMALAMEAARDAGKPVVVLDRPNPLGGLTIDGPVLEPQFRSFIGLYPVPLVHGMTIGELARLFNDAFGIRARLSVVPMEGWARAMTWAETRLGWVNPSPGITSEDAPFFYAATGPLDGTNLWNGVGTSSRFQVVLAPWLDGTRLAERLNRQNLPGVRFSPSAVPHPRSGRIYRGVRLHITDRLKFRPAATAVTILAEVRRLHPDRFGFTRSRSGRYLFDVVWGTKGVRLALARGEPAASIVSRWQPALATFQRRREPYLLYR